MKRPTTALTAVLLLTAGVLLAAGPAAAETAATAPAATTPAASADTGTAARDDAKPVPAPLADLLAAMDPSADPCTDFYQYACGGWIAHTEIPSDESRWVRSFSEIQKENREIVRDILEDAAAHPERSADDERIGNYFGSCMDQAAIDEAGTKPLQPWLDKIAAVDGPTALFRLSGELGRLGAYPFLDTAVFPDFKDPDTNIAFFAQGGLGMPERDYYVSDDAKKKELLAAYEKHVAHMLGLLGEKTEKASADAAAIVAFETELAEVSRPAAEMRQVEKLYNKIDLAGLEKLTPELPWPAYLAGTGHPEVRQINVATPEFFERLQTLVAETDLDTLRAYLRWNLVNATASRLPSAFEEADFDFYGRQISGQQEMQPRWKRCVAATQQAMGEVVGRVYVERRFAGDSKRIAKEMIGDITAAFEAGLPKLSWMDDATRKRAVEKARAVVDKIGYPDQWRDYSELKVVPGDYFGNFARASAFEFDFQADKIGKPVDKTEWAMTPQRVNAYYNPLFNEIVFPAGILQPPFFSKDFPAAMNYGAIGAVIGHELTHGFDDSGRKFAPDGELREWWEPEVSQRFEERAQCVRDLYSTYEVEDGVHVQGDLTAGENIADIGGLKQAYAAYKRWESRHGQPELPVDLTPDQLLFLAFGQVWCAEASPEFLRLQVTTNPHSPPRFRVLGPVSNNPEFAAAFGCQAGQPMAPKNRCEVW